MHAFLLETKHQIHTCITQMYLVTLILTCVWLVGPEWPHRTLLKEGHSHDLWQSCELPDKGRGIF